jgi:hypothetical protein
LNRKKEGIGEKKGKRGENGENGRGEHKGQGVLGKAVFEACREIPENGYFSLYSLGRMPNVPAGGRQT